MSAAGNSGFFLRSHYTVIPMVTRKTVDHIGDMRLGNPPYRHRPAQARSDQRSFLRREGSRLMPARHGRRVGDIGNAWYSTAPLVVFVLAGLLVVGAVSLLALHPTLWMLLYALAIYAAATGLVLRLVLAMLDED